MKRKQLWKKLLSVTMAAAMAMTAAPSVIMAGVDMEESIAVEADVQAEGEGTLAAEGQDKTAEGALAEETAATVAEEEKAGADDSALLADFTFDDDANGFSSDNAKATGSYTLADSYGSDGKALYLDGSSTNYLTVTAAGGSSLLTGVDEMTISYDVKPDRTETNWAFYAAPSDASNTYQKEQYIGILMNGGTTTVERYNNSGSRPSNPSAATGSDWIHVDVVLTTADTAIYLDGAEVSRVASTYGIADLLGSSSILQIGKANWGSGEYFKGYLDNYRIYGKALNGEELPAPDAAYMEMKLEQKAASITEVTLDDGRVALSDYDGTVTWKSDMSQVTILENGLTAIVQQPEKGENAITGTLTAVLSLYDMTREVQVKATINPAAGAEDAYGYLMVHFIEDSAGYAEKIYLDISRGDNPQQWDPLNSGQPILASNLGTTGTRDPFLTYNPETETYYILGTDLRVFGGDEAGWGSWQNNYSTKMNIWESKNLITWSEVRQFDVVRNQSGEKQANLGMMWAPEATWVSDYYGEGKGAFVVYWSSALYEDEAQTVSSGGSCIMWGTTTDFTQDTWEYGGVFLNGGSSGYIDTTIAQDGDTTYHITKSHSEQIIMESTTDKEWWKSTNWKRIQSEIGKSRFGSVEGPAVFKDHSHGNRWYLFVDDLPTPGYQPMYSDDLTKGFDYLDSTSYFLTENTKHGGVISLTKAQYDAIRAADAVSAVTDDLGTVEVAAGTAAEELKKALPEAEVNLAYDMGTSQLPVAWDVSKVDLHTAGTYEVTGLVQSISANKDQWVGKNGSTAYNAQDRELYRSRAIAVKASVKVTENTVEPTPTPDKPVIAKVSGVKAVPTTSMVKLSWKKAADVTGYKVYRYNSSKKTYIEIGTTKKTSYTDKSRKSATAYSYAIRAYVVADGQTYLGVQTKVKTLTKPAKPTSVKAMRITKVSEKTKATITFKKVSRATSYQIYKYNKSTKKYTLAYKLQNNKLYKYNSKTKKYTKVNAAKVKNGKITCTLTKLNLKTEKSQKYKVRVAVSKSGYTTRYSAYSKAVTVK